MGVVIAGIVLVVVIGAIGFTYFVDMKGGVDTGELITQSVGRGAFDHIVLEQGEIDSSSNIEVDCKVKSSGSGSGGVAILWVIDEGNAGRSRRKAGGA